MMEKLATPLRELPARGPNSARRTQSLQIRPQTTWDLDLRLLGVACDSRVDDAGRVSSDEPTVIELDIDAQSRIAAMVAPLRQEVIDRFVGRPSIGGFRSMLTSLADEIAPPSPVAALLDDVPTVRLISGYGRLMKQPPRPTDPPSHPILNVCRGWAEGDTAYRLAMSGQSVVNTTTPAPSLDELLADSGDFHAEPAVRPDSMCRRRILEVTPAGGDFLLFEYLRDSYVDDDGAESSLHEYVVRARVDADYLIQEIEVEPRALPFPECPLAAPNAGSLRGTSLREIHRSVRDRLSGTAGCTHLSDTLRFLRFTEPLSRASRGGTGPA
jgi:hypothetical protein